MNTKKVAGSIILILIICEWIYIFATGAPKLPIGTANGSYANSCCGTLVLKNGRMIVANQYVSYVIERDKGGAYVLPTDFVGAVAGGFVVRRGDYPLKLRLDTDTRPRWIDLRDNKPESADYSFSLTDDR